MNQYFPTILRSSERCCGPVLGSTGDVRLFVGESVFADLGRIADLGDMKRADAKRHDYSPKSVNGISLGNSFTNSIFSAAFTATTKSTTTDNGVPAIPIT